MTPFRQKTGAPPGTMVYSGKDTTEQVKITLIEYDEHNLIEREFYDIDECMASVQPDMVKWINVDGIHNVDLVERIGRLFSIHPLTLEDIVNTAQRPKFEDYDDYVVSVMKMVYYDTEIHSEQLTIVLRENMIISFQEVHGGDAFDLIRIRIRQAKGRIRKQRADYLFYALHDAVVDCYFTVLEKLGDQIELLEDELVEEPQRKTLNRLHHMKRQMIYIRKVVWPVRELINNIQRSETSLICESTEIYFRDVHDHSIRVIDTVETYRDLLSGMMDIYLSSVSNKMNEVMKVLTIISTIFIPVTFIAGVYGMNFENMPEIRSENGYWITWGVMVAIMGVLVYYFRRKRWL
jgi:magnesium transporter